MGKVHRIKKQFWRLVSQEPLPNGRAHLAGVKEICIQPTIAGTQSIYQYLSHHTYTPLAKKLLNEYNAKQGSS